MFPKNRIWRLLLTLLLSAVPLSAQVVTGAISGRVTDTTGAVIPAAKIQVQNVETGFTRNVEADASGRYVARNLPLGSYAITVQQDGFRTEVRRGITLTVGSEVVVNMELSVGAVQERVEVTGEAPTIETTTATLSGLVNQEQMRELPLNGRSYDQLALLSLGVAEQPQGNRNQIVGGGTRLTVNGARPNSTLYLMDGATVNDYTAQGPGSAAGQNLGVEAIREFRVLTHSFSAEYGRNGGAVISTVTRSGTNEFHGSVYEFFRNNVLDARDFFNPGELPPFRRNQFGASLGGPVLRDHVFFFANYEALREREGVTIISSVPDLNARRGLLPDPATGELRQVPLNPVVVPYLNLYPLPNGRPFTGGTAEFVTDASTSKTEDYFMSRMDFNLSENDNLYWRYIYNPSESSRPRSFPQFFDTDEGTNHFALLSATRILSATSLNEFRFAFNRTIPRTGTGSIGVDPSLDFIPGLGLGSISFTTTGTATGSSGGLIPELGTRRPAPQIFLQNLFQVNDNFSYVKGAHSFKLGFDLDRMQLNLDQLAAQRGFYQFGSLADFLAGRPNRLQFGFVGGDSSAQRGWRNILLGWFVQDDIRVGPRLTLNLGVRHEFITTPVEVNGRSANLLHITDTESTLGPPFIPGKLNIAPRAGLAWDPTGSGRTSIRLGGGVFHNQLMGRNWGSTAGSEYRFNTTYTVNNPPNFPRALESGFRPGGKTTNSVVLHPDNPTIIQYNLEIQRELLPTVSLRTAYVGSQGYNLDRRVQSNTAIPQIQPNGSKFFPVGAPRVNPNFGDIQTLVTDSMSNYNSLQVGLQKNLSQGLQLQANYTWGKALSNADSTFSAELFNNVPTAMDQYDLDREYGLSSYHQKHTFVTNARYRFPWDSLLQSGWAKAALGGWTVNGIYRLGSGFPINIRTGFNNARDANPELADRPDLTPGFRSNPTEGTTAGCQGIPAGEKLGTPDRFFDPCAFLLPAAGTYGNLGRNTLIGHPRNNLDFTVVKTTALRERTNLEFRAEFFNLFNHPLFGPPNNTVFTTARTRSGNAGRIINTASDSRQIQFGLKLTF